MNVVINMTDIKRLSKHLGIKVAEFIDKYVEKDEDGDYVIREKPCPFLGEDNRCTFYELRPTVCREYPHTNKKGFTSRTYGVSANALNCPAVFWIIERMRELARR